MNTAIEIRPKTLAAGARVNAGTAFGCARNFLTNHLVYTVISPRARGLSVGVNLTPDKNCNFDCVYCEVDRRAPGGGHELDLDALSTELETTLTLVHAGKLRENPLYALVPSDLLRLRHVAISGDGEPTLCPRFREAVETVVHVRATSRVPFFKIVLITNASNLNAEVQGGLQLLTRHDEIWTKLDAGTQAHLARVNRTEIPLEKVLANILSIGRERPVIIQSLFLAVDGIGPSDGEVNAYVQRLKELKAAGAQIPLVQIYSATRPAPHSECGHLPLKILSQIAQAVRRETGLNAEIF